MSLLKDLSVSQSQTIVELALHKLATLSWTGLSEYEQSQANEIQTQIAIFLVEQINHREAQLLKQRAMHGQNQLQSALASANEDSILGDDPIPHSTLPRESYLDWSLKIDLRKNKERTVQTSPIPVDG